MPERHRLEGMHQCIKTFCSLKRLQCSQVYVGLGGANYPTWPSSSPSGYTNTAAKSLIAFATKNNIQGYDLDFENGLNDDWVTQWSSIVFQLEVSIFFLLLVFCFLIQCLPCCVDIALQICLPANLPMTV